MLIFNEVNLLDYIIIEDNVEIQELPTRENKKIEIPSRHGGIYTGHRYVEKSIKVPFWIHVESTEEYVLRVRKLKNILNTNEPKKLHLPDELTKFYYAVISSFECKEISVGLGRGDLEFICYDPYAYNDELKLFTSDENKITTIINEGTANCSPIINVAFTQDAHFLQVTNWDKQTILIGSRPSVDNSYLKDEIVLHDECAATTEWLPAGNVLDSEVERLVEGNVTISKDGTCISPSAYGSTTDKEWHGAAVRRNIGLEIEDFELTARFKFDASGSTDSSSSGTTSSNYKVTASALNVRKGRGTKYGILGCVKKGTKLNVKNISGGWGQITYNSKTGYVSMKYVKAVASSKLSTRNRSMTITDKEIHNDNKMGRACLYGFDKNGQKLFRFTLKDSQEFYEYTEPELYIGNKLVLEDGLTCPAPKKKTETDPNDKDKTIKVDTESGRYGSWNEYEGEFKISRVTKNDIQYWSCEINKWVNGKVSDTQKLTKTNLVSKDYPSGDLHHLVLWFGQYKDKPTMDVIGLDELTIKKLADREEGANIVNFVNGDELEINCKLGEVRLNGGKCMNLVDIGSIFFENEPGASQFICKSDDPNIEVATLIQEKWI